MSDAAGNDESLLTDQEQVEEEEEEVEEVAAPLTVAPKNVSTYPQANAHYFATREYVRKDKFTMSTMLFKDLVLPTMESIYE